MATKQLLRAVLTVVGTLLISPGSASCEERPADIVVHTYNYAGEPLDTLAAARRQVDAIFHTVNISIAWIDCRTTPREAEDVLPTCRTNLGPEEVMLRILSSAPPKTERVSLGFSWVNRENANAAWLASVFADRVRALASQASLDPAVLLGRAIAHEIGHLLIGSTSHPSQGLMRAYWSHTELTQNSDKEWTFLEGEARTMRASVMTRTSRTALARR